MTKKSLSAVRPNDGRRGRVPNSKFAKLLRKYGGCMNDLAQVLGITRQAIYHWERVPEQHLERVARYLEKLKERA